MPKIGKIMQIHADQWINLFLPIRLLLQHDEWPGFMQTPADQRLAGIINASWIRRSS
jgi:hypothetical protein